MKKLKKMVAVLLTVVMAMAMGVTVFASDAKGTLTVNVQNGETLAGQTVNVYKLFDVTKSGENHYGYKVNEQYKTILKSVLGENLTTETDQGYYDAVVKATDGDNGTNTQKFANDFTRKLLEYNKDLNNADSKISADKSKKFENNATDTKWDVTDLSYGYYLVCQTGTKEIQSSLVELSGDTATVNLKSEAPSIDKTVDNKKLESVQIGDTITYTIKGEIPDSTGYTSYVYRIHDELSEGLDFVGNTANVKIGNAEAVPVEFTTETGEAGNTKKMTLDLSEYVTGNAGKAVTVTYQAKVNSKANVGTVNKAELEYSNNPSDENSHTTTPPSTVKTPTYPLDIKKTDTDNNLLADAKFKLYTSESDAKADNGNSTVKVTGENGKYTVAENQEEISTDKIISIADKLSGNEDYNLQLNGLKAGTYYLVETEAPDGYNKISDPITIVIKDSEIETDATLWTISKNGADETDKVIDIQNSTGTILPSTGGTGTIIFSIVAGVLILGVAASFIKDRKKEA